MFRFSAPVPLTHSGNWLTWQYLCLTVMFLQQLNIHLSNDLTERTKSTEEAYITSLFEINPSHWKSENGVTGYCLHPSHWICWLTTAFSIGSSVKSCSTQGQSTFVKEQQVLHSKASAISSFRRSSTYKMPTDTPPQTTALFHGTQHAKNQKLKLLIGRTVVSLNRVLYNEICTVTIL